MHAWSQMERWSWFDEECRKDKEWGQDLCMVCHVQAFLHIATSLRMAAGSGSGKIDCPLRMRNSQILFYQCSFIKPSTGMPCYLINLLWLEQKHPSYFHLALGAPKMPREAPCAPAV
jgi:hypothetical protein